MPSRATPNQSASWLRHRMQELGLPTLDHLAEICGIDKGNQSRIFRQAQRPRVTTLEPLAAALDVSIYELLVRIGAVDPDRSDAPTATIIDGRSLFVWPRAV